MFSCHIVNIHHKDNDNDDDNDDKDHRATPHSPPLPHPIPLQCFCSFSVSSTLPHVVFSCHIVNIHNDDDEKEEDYHAVHRNLFP